MNDEQISVEYVEHMGGDLSVVNAARVSFGKAKEKIDAADTKLIRYLARHKHETPFRHVQATVRCTAPIFLARQLGKHQIGLSWNEVSRRYVDDEPGIYMPGSWRMLPDKSIKQGSGAPANNAHNDWNNDDYNEAVDACLHAYNQMIERGTAPEMARMVLPQSMLTEWVWTGSLQAFAHIYKLRSGSHAQQEAQAFARALYGIMSGIATESWAALTQ